jgi:hypothetical protein
MDWLNAGALSLMLMMLVGTFHLGAILTGEVGTVARHAANLVDVQPLIEKVKLPNYNEPVSVSSKATLLKGDDSDSAEQVNLTTSKTHCELLGGNYEGNCCSGPDGMCFFKTPGLFR